VNILSSSYGWGGEVEPDVEKKNYVNKKRWIA